MPQVKFLDTPAKDEQTEVRPPKSHRDETQRHIDDVFKGLTERWVKAGKPAPADARYPAHRFVVAKSDVSALKAMIRRAAALHKHDVTWWKDVKTEEGAVSVKFGPAPKAGEKIVPATTGDGNKNG